MAKKKRKKMFFERKKTCKFDAKELQFIQEWSQSVAKKIDQ